MWPLSAILELGGDLVVVGTDDPAVARSWRPWQCDDSAFPDAVLVDYGIELAASDQTETAMRPLASLRHGSVALGRSQDASSLLSAFWRVLGAWSSPPADAAVRVDAVPVVTESGIVLVDRSVAGLLPHRRLAERGTPVLPVHHVDLDLVDDAPRITVAGPLVGPGDPVVAPLAGWVAGPPADGSDATRAARIAWFARSIVDAQGGPAGRRRIDTLARALDAVPPVAVEGGRTAVVDAVCALAVAAPR